MICESVLICETLLNKKLWIFDSRIENDSRIIVDSRINLESNHFKKRFESTFSLCSNWNHLYNGSIQYNLYNQIISQNSDLWVMNQFKNWFESSMIRKSFLIRESLLNKKIVNFWFVNQSWIELFQKNVWINFVSLFLQKIATRFESWIIDSDLLWSTSSSADMYWEKAAKIMQGGWWSLQNYDFSFLIFRH